MPVVPDSWSITPHRLVALLGPNGAGKTTSIALMLGLRRPTAGQALLFGLDPNDGRARSGGPCPRCN